MDWLSSSLISLISVGVGIVSLSSSIPKRCNPIASLAFVIASCVVSPQVKQPSRSGNSTEIPSLSKEKILG